ncbi:MAG: UPF0182 family protein, partial [Candidatus Binataceae bacterium]
MRPRFILFGAAAIIIVALIILSLVDNLFINLLWFGALGYRSVYVTTLVAEVAIFVGIWVIAFIPIYVSGLVALHFSHEREHLRVVRR